ncbi:MAG: hypothetical protein F4239_00530 [Gammaproteobacteria bacterium]|nr:hypothetical protein [Gammaproteobacteria bacterium]
MITEPINKFCLAIISVAAMTFSTNILAVTIQHVENSNSELTQAEIETAEAWNLSREEFSQIKLLKSQYQGLLSADLTPLEWLGIFATSDEQRNHYAKLFAERQLQTTAAILKFETAYITAVRELSSNALPAVRDIDRLVLITPYECSDSKCVQDLQKGMNYVKKGGSLDIYVQAESQFSDLTVWASTNQISSDDVRTGRITLKQAKGRMLNVKPGIYRAN